LRVLAANEALNTSAVVVWGGHDKHCAIFVWGL